MGTLREAADAAMKLVSQVFEKEGRLGPVWLITTPNGVNIVQGEFTGSDSKDVIVAAIRDKFGSTASRIIFACECWMKTVKCGQDDGLPPSQSPDRVELIHIIAEDKTGEQLVLTRKIQRNEAGEPSLLPTDAHTYNFIAGRMASFFKPPETTKH